MTSKLSCKVCGQREKKNKTVFDILTLITFENFRNLDNFCWEEESELLGVCLI